MVVFEKKNPDVKISQFTVYEQVWLPKQLDIL